MNCSGIDGCFSLTQTTVVGFPNPLYKMTHLHCKTSIESKIFNGIVLGSVLNFKKKLQAFLIECSLVPEKRLGRCPKPFNSDRNYSAHWTLRCTVCCTLFAKLCTLHRHSAHYTLLLHTAYCMLYTEHWMLRIVCCTLQFARCS